MIKEVIGQCPVCQERLIATKLCCSKCQIEIAGEFSLNKFSYLTKEELEFVSWFLQSEGNFKDVQGRLNITYHRAKQILADILVKLDLKSESEQAKDMSASDQAVKYLPVEESDHFIVKLIKEKLNENGGHADLTLISGKKARIWFEANGKGLECDKIPVPNQLTWEAFVAAYNIAVPQEGEVYKGYARAGKLGSEKLPITSLEGYIAHTVHGVEEGESAYSPGFIIAAVLDWVGIFVNERGSTVKLVNEKVFVDSYEEALDNAKTFLEGLGDSQVIQDRLSNFRHWYYFEELDSFAPSKFIGYKHIDMKAYEVYYRNLTGLDTEKELPKFFKEAEKGEQAELYAKLEKFLDVYNKKPNAKTKIHVRK